MSGAGPSGLLVVDKPIELSSFDVIRRLRRPLGTRALGHTGTLDPLASGVLCVCVRWATKLIRFLAEDHKVYEAVLRLGQSTETHDAESRVIAEGEPVTDASLIEAALRGFRGEIDQVPPRYSALRLDGERAYRLARRGETVDLPPRRVRIDELELVGIEAPDVRLRVTCGQGTYIRSLSRDLGQALGCGAHLVALRRLQSGPFTIEQARPLDALVAGLDRGENPLVPPLEILGHLPLVELDPDVLHRLRCGQWVEAPAPLGEADFVRVREGETLAAVAKHDAGWLKPVRVRPS